MSSNGRQGDFTAAADRMMDMSLAGIAVFFLLSWSYAFIVMLALGAAHSQWPAIPAFGYLTTWILLFGLQVLVKVFR